MDYSLEQMARMALLVRESSDPRTDEQVLADTRYRLMQVLDHNALPLDGSYSFNAWVGFKNNYAISQFLEMAR